MDKNKVLNIVRRYKSLMPPAFSGAEVYLYGSYSKGTAREDSDIDVAVVIPECKSDWLEASASLWDVSTKLNSLIEPVLIEKKYESPLYLDILKTGIAV